MGSEINGLVVDDRVPGPRQAAEAAVWLAAVREWVAKRRPEVDAAISRRVKASPASEGYRRLDALLVRQGLGCNPNRVRRIMRRHGGFRYWVLFLQEERFVSIVELLPRA